MRGPGLLFVVSGPSGAGKDTLVDALRTRMPRLRYSVSATTREPRPGERDGEAYFFYDRELFEAKARASAFLETKEYNGHFYGTPREFVETTLADGYDVIMKPEVNGALAVKTAFSEAVLVFLLPDKFSHLRLRLAARRTESSDEIAARLAIAHGELGAIRAFDYVIINEQAPPEFRHEPPAVDDLEAIVKAERFRIHHYDDATFRSVEDA
ncbi:MAG: guanylate kinase [Candidatus Eremiobacteraeota bacterium]|nr:guanylate kinase [Candidatus Eremiobacteraeota bacterium]